jgi:hypothetical protein
VAAGDDPMSPGCCDSYRVYITTLYQFQLRISSNGSRDSAVGTATGCGLDDEDVGVRVPGGSNNFLFPTSARLALGSNQPPIQCAPRALSPGVKWPRREADHSPPTSAEVK